MHPSSLQLPDNFSIGPVHSPVRPLQIEHTNEPCVTQQAFRPTMSQPQPLRSTVNRKPYHSVQPQQPGTSDLLSATATSTFASPGNSCSATPVGVVSSVCVCMCVCVCVCVCVCARVPICMCACMTLCVMWYDKYSIMHIELIPRARIYAQAMSICHLSSVCPV